MFAVKFGQKTIKATAVEERWNEPSAYDNTSYNLTIEMTPAEMEVQDYEAILTAEGALDPIEVSLDGAPCGTYTGYKTVRAISVRLLAGGGKSASIVLTKEQ